jgi:phosphoglycolate phosphatase-like HAD superfamily hydrolase
MKTGWFKSSASSDNAHCVKIRFDDDTVMVGDTKNDHLGAAQPVLQFSTAQWGHVLSAHK